MLIELQKTLTKFNIKPKGVIQVGSHFCEEHEDFIKCGIERFVYIEPCKEAFEVMKERIDNENAVLINVACGAEESELPMYISKQNQGQSNSFLKSHLHSIQHPDILFTDTEVIKVVTLDSLQIEKAKYDLLVMDTEGYEGEVLKGAKKTLKYINCIYTEVQRGVTRIGNILIEELEDILWEEGFVMVETFWPSPNFTWGDAIFIRKSFVHP